MLGQGHTIWSEWCRSGSLGGGRGGRRAPLARLPVRPNLLQPGSVGAVRQAAPSRDAELLAEEGHLGGGLRRGDTVAAAVRPALPAPLRLAYGVHGVPRRPGCPPAARPRVPARPCPPLQCTYTRPPAASASRMRRTARRLASAAGARPRRVGRRSSSTDAGRWTAYASPSGSCAGDSRLTKRVAPQCSRARQGVWGGARADEQRVRVREEVAARVRRLRLRHPQGRSVG